MSLDFQPRLSVLPAPQRRLWDELAGTPREFVLYRGTALALHFGHRTSIDFDFFGDRAFEPGRLASTLPSSPARQLLSRSRTLFRYPLIATDRSKFRSSVCRRLSG
jgi:hypothetical protein